MSKPLPIGISQFRKIRESQSYYADKTLLIEEWLQATSEVTLITRPRRFGKTLNMTMLREFFDITADSRALFNGLAISHTKNYAKINQYPVIFLSMKDCKGKFEDVMTCIYKTLQEIYTTVLQLTDLSEVDYRVLNHALDVLIDFDFARKAVVQDAIFMATKLLSKHYGKKAIVLIDEYDTPMISANEQGYYDEVHFFFSSLYSSALKDNPYLERAMLTGIHRIARENIFSGLNNLEVCTVRDKLYQEYFGLTPEETEILLTEYDLELTGPVTNMYDGYLFGEQEIYNPWSIINYAKQKKLEPYWVNTASNQMLVKAMSSAEMHVREDFEQLITKGQAKVPLDLQTSFVELKQPATLWGLFLNSGYLTTVTANDPAALKTLVRIPNEEVRISFRKIVENYGGFAANSLDDLFDALLHNDMTAFERSYEQIILTCTSFHDGRENAYHMLFLGMCVYLNQDYHITSNTERGQGRPDICLEAKRPDMPNIICEFKQGENVEQLADQALTQIQQKQYYAGLKGETLLLGIAHNLKQCRIKTATLIL